jgi:hypothetical protein
MTRLSARITSDSGLERSIQQGQLSDRISVAITAGAVLIQTGILVALFITVRKSISRIDVLVSDVKTEVLPKWSTRAIG